MHTQPLSFIHSTTFFPKVSVAYPKTEADIQVFHKYPFVHASARQLNIVHLLHLSSCDADGSVSWPPFLPKSTISTLVDYSVCTTLQHCWFSSQNIKCRRYLHTLKQSSLDVTAKVCEDWVEGFGYGIVCGSVGTEYVLVRVQAGVSHLSMPLSE